VAPGTPLRTAWRAPHWVLSAARHAQEPLPPLPPSCPADFRATALGTWGAFVLLGDADGNLARWDTSTGRWLPARPPAFCIAARPLGLAGLLAAALERAGRSIGWCRAQLRPPLLHPTHRLDLQRCLPALCRTTVVETGHGRVHKIYGAPPPCAQLHHNAAAGERAAPSSAPRAPARQGRPAPAWPLAGFRLSSA
jgi:hypothetical protein